MPRHSHITQNSHTLVQNKQSCIPLYKHKSLKLIRLIQILFGFGSNTTSLQAKATTFEKLQKQGNLVEQLQRQQQTKADLPQNIYHLRPPQLTMAKSHNIFESTETILRVRDNKHFATEADETNLRWRQDRNTHRRGCSSIASSAQVESTYQQQMGEGTQNLNMFKKQNFIIYILMWVIFNSILWVFGTLIFILSQNNHIALDYFEGTPLYFNVLPRSFI